ncbi:Helix-turn-helix [Faunimonas pinastri]|uniref:Helix-turn-helix n=1 Tax=Faunimonas pinastri TaxID=1855383 RepID=A0A1H9QW84_9HYPH|nr:helix-turn-helix transcriptional regulator [Faunimonas pinastri]SER64732.1 Helix-turn-helix [Faunimonas pinastri]
MPDRLTTRSVGEDDRHIGGKVRDKRRELGISLQDLAEMLEISPQQIQKYETGQNRLSASRLSQIATALKTSLCFFVPPRTPC